MEDTEITEEISHKKKKGFNQSNKSDVVFMKYN